MYFIHQLGFSHTCNLIPQWNNENLFPTVIYPQKVQFMWLLNCKWCHIPAVNKRVDPPLLQEKEDTTHERSFQLTS